MRSQLVSPPVPTGHHGDPGLALDGKGRVAICARNLCEHDSEKTAREQQRIAYDPEPQGPKRRSPESPDIPPVRKRIRF